MPSAVTTEQVLMAGAALAGLLLLAWMSYKLIGKAARKSSGPEHPALVGQVLGELRWPVALGLALAGLYLALRSLPLTDRATVWVNAGAWASLAALGVYGGAAVVESILHWYGQVMAPQTQFGLDDRIVAVARKLVPLAAGPLAVLLVLSVFGVELPAVRRWLVDPGSRLALIAILALASTLLVSRVGPTVVRTAVMRRATEETEQEVMKRGQTLSAVLVTTTQVAILGVAVFMLLAEVDLNITPLLTGVGVAGIAIGFGAQSLIRDLLGGFFVIMENQYRVGDVVRIADIAGLVEEINLRRTVLRDLDGIVHVVPNGEVRVASNFTKGWSRVNLNISVAYKEDLDHVMEVINRVGKELSEDPAWAPLILKPPQALRVDNLGDSGIEIKVLGDTQPIKQWDVMGELRKRLKKAFDEEGIEIPWPHTKVYFGDTPPIRPWEQEPSRQGMRSSNPTPGDEASPPRSR